MQLLLSLWNLQWTQQKRNLSLCLCAFRRHLLKLCAYSNTRLIWSWMPKGRILMLVLPNFKTALPIEYFLFCRAELLLEYLDIECMRQIPSLICIVKMLWSISFNTSHLDQTYCMSQLNNKKVLSWIQWRHSKECKQIWKKQHNSIFENVFKIF